MLKQYFVVIVLPYIFARCLSICFLERKVIRFINLVGPWLTMDLCPRRTRCARSCQLVSSSDICHMYRLKSSEPERTNSSFGPPKQQLFIVQLWVATKKVFLVVGPLRQVFIFLLFRQFLVKVNFKNLVPIFFKNKLCFT